MAATVFDELLYGLGAHANTLASVQNIPVDVAGRRVEPFPHSIWHLVWHMNFWMEYELKRIRGENPRYPAHASESWPQDAAPRTAADWQEMVFRFETLLAELKELASSPPNMLSKEVALTHVEHTRRSGSLHAVLWQTLVHNSYHIGQVAMLRRMFGAWPPKSDGDTW